MTSSILTQFRRPKFLLAFFLPVLMLKTGCNEEPKAKKAAINDLESKLHQESEKLYGKNPKGVVKEFADAIESKRDWTVTEIKIDGAPASLNEIKMTGTEFNFTAKKNGDSFRVAKFDEVSKSKK